MPSSFVLSLVALILAAVAVALYANGYLSASIILAFVAAALQTPWIRRERKRRRG